MTESTPGLNERMVADESGFDPWDPANLAPLIGWLCSDTCEATGQVYWLFGSKVARYLEWSKIDRAETDGQWTIEALAETLGAWEMGVVASRDVFVEEISYR